MTRYGMSTIQRTSFKLDRSRCNFTPLLIHCRKRSLCIDGYLPWRVLLMGSVEADKPVLNLLIPA